MSVIKVKPDYDVVVVGGGPAGSTIASLLAKKQRRVLLLEKEKFPRYHIGESLVTGVIPILQELGVLEKVDAHGFIKKYGVTFLWGNAREEPWTVFWDEAQHVKSIPFEHAYQVVRSEFDEILLKHAESLGVEVREESRVVDVLFEDGRCVGVNYQQPDGTIHEARAHYTIDATGQSALLGRYTNAVEYDPDLKNIAVWSYYKNATRLEGRSAGNILVENTPEGWLWFVPLHEGKTSVGWVAPIENLKSSQEKDLETRYTQIVNNAVKTGQMLAGAERIDKVRTIRDWSYKCKKFSGPGFLMTGDAAGFVDPLFSTGVFLAMNGASLGAKMVDKVLENNDMEDELFEQYEFAYKKFLNVVTSFVHFFYDASKEQDYYFAEAQNLVDPISKMQARQDFVYLISGLAGLHTIEDELTVKNAQLIPH